MGSGSYKFLIAIYILGAILASSRAIAFIFADSTGVEAVISAGELDIGISAGQDFSPALRPGKIAERSIMLTATSAAEAAYSLRAENAVDPLCAHLLFSLSGTTGSASSSGPLIGFSATTSEVSVWPQDIRFSLSLDTEDVSWKNQQCAFDIIIDAWQKDAGYNSGGFTDQEILSNVVLTAGWQDEEGQANPGDVVINELMWMGSQASNEDQWIELRNMTGREISLAGWRIENVLRNRGTIILPGSASVPPQGYFMIGRYHASSPKSLLAADPDFVHGNLYLKPAGNGDIILRDKDSDLIDSASGEVWPSGKNIQVWQSMQRNYLPGNGLDAENWHTATDESANDSIYWDEEDLTFGTPKHENCSSADPTYPGLDPSKSCIDMSCGSATIKDALATVGVEETESPAVKILETDLSENTPPTIETSSSPGNDSEVIVIELN